MNNRSESRSNYTLTPNSGKRLCFIAPLLAASVASVVSCVIDGVEDSGAQGSSTAPSMTTDSEMSSSTTAGSTLDVTAGTSDNGEGTEDLEISTGSGEDGSAGGETSASEGESGSRDEETGETHNPPGTDAGVVMGQTGPILVAVATAFESAVPGQRLQYAITVSNTSSAAVDGVRVVFRVPDGIQFNYRDDALPDASCGSSNCNANREASWDLGSLMAGTSRTITINAHVLTDVSEGDVIDVTIRVDTADADIMTLNLDKRVNVDASRSAEVTLATASDQVLAGEDFTYYVHVGHVGPERFENAALDLRLPDGVVVKAVSDDGMQVEGGVAWSVGEVPVGASFVREVDVTVIDSAGAGDLLPASARFSVDGPATVEASSQHVLTILDESNPLHVVFIAETSPAVPGSRLRMVASIVNRSARTVEDVVVVLRVPEGLSFNYVGDAAPDSSCGSSTCDAHREAVWEIGNLSAGAGTSIVVNGTVVDSLVVDGGLVTSRLEVLSATTLPMRAIESIPIRTVSDAELSLGTTVNPVTPGESFVLDLTIGQIGEQPLVGTELRAWLPLGVSVVSISEGGVEENTREITWPIGDVAVADSVRHWVEVIVDEDIVVGQILDPFAIVTYDGGLVVDGRAEVTIPTVSAALPLVLDVAVEPDTATPGEMTMFNATVTNRSNRTVDDVTLWMRVPPEVSFHYTRDAEPDTSCGSSTCDAHREAVWSIGSLGPQQSLIATVNAAVAGSRPVGSLIESSFWVSAAGMDNAIRVQNTIPIE